MNYEIDNEFLEINADSYGAELHSIKTKNNPTEFLWNGDEKYWKYHAPILFPIVGKVTDNKYRIGGNTFELPQHGFGRVSDFKLIDKSTDSLTFELRFNENSLKVYPYKFSLKVSYTLIENKLKISYIVDNLDNKAIYFSIGAHPAFLCTLAEGETINDYYFEFDQNESTSIMELSTTTGLYTNKNIPFLNNENIIPLSKELFKNDALVFRNLKSNKIFLKSKNHSKYMSMDFTGFPYLGLWSKPTGAPFVCIEPWYGHADYEGFTGDFSDKEGVESLQIGESFSCSYILEFNS
ncbi:MAG: aldose 1-epimerase family protein [Clostridiaceae bacterium]